MDVFEQKEQVSSPQLQSSEKELRGTAKATMQSWAAHPTMATEHLVTGAGWLLSWCCTTSVILAACEFPTNQERKIAFFFSAPADERVFVPGYHQRLDRGFGREKQLWGPSLSLRGLSGPGVGMRWEGLHSHGVPAEGSQAEGCVQLASLKQVSFQSSKQWPGLKKSWIWDPVLSLTSWVALGKWFHFPIIQFSTCKTYLTEFCIPRWEWRTAQKSPVTWERVSSQHCPDSGHRGEAGWPGTANVSGE